MSKSAGRVLVVGSAACRAHARTALSRLPYEFAAVDDPYAAAMELCRRPLAYRAVVLCLNSVFREELGLISLIKSRMRHLELYLSQTDGRQAAIVDATRRGADAILSDDGLHRFDEPALTSHPLTELPPESPQRKPGALAPDANDDAAMFSDASSGDAVLTAEELRALLQEQPSLPPGSDS